MNPLINIILVVLVLMIITTAILLGLSLYQKQTYPYTTRVCVSSTISLEEEITYNPILKMAMPNMVPIDTCIGYTSSTVTGP